MVGPLYVQILNDLKDQIQKGQLAPGAQLPTEKELSEQYQVSRITSKRALTELEQAGLIERTRGKGSFVKETILNSQQTGRILFLLPFTNDLSLGNFSTGLIPLAKKAGYEVMMTNYEFLDSHQANDIIREFDGVIYYAEDETKYLDLLFELAYHQFPLVILDKEIHDLAFPAVLSDNFGGGKLACEHLIDLGHQKIAYIFGDLIHPQSTRQRYLGYIQGLREHQLAFHTTLEEIQARPTQLVAYVKENQITGLVCENDITAIAAMKELKAANFRVPEDISIVGFDDIQAAALVDPPLTTISQNFQTLGQIAGEKLLAWIKTGQPTDSAKVKVNLISRQSTAALLKK